MAWIPRCYADSMSSQEPRGPAPVDRVRGEHPDSEEWRADALAKSRHARLADELVEPLEDHDPRKAARICAEVTRSALGDFAPALILLPRELRERAQALAAYALTLFDFARQTGVEGEKLAAVNRWEFTLETALAGDPPGQPVFVMMAREQLRQPWPDTTLDGLADSARRRVVQTRPPGPEALEADAKRLAATLAGAFGVSEGSSTGDLLEISLRLSSLQLLGEQIRRMAPRLPITELADPPPGESYDPAELERSIQFECDRIDSLQSNSGTIQPGRPQTRAERYLANCNRHLASRIRQLGRQIVQQPPHVGLGRRMMWLARSRWA